MMLTDSRASTFPGYFAPCASTSGWSARRPLSTWP